MDKNYRFQAFYEVETWKDRPNFFVMHVIIPGIEAMLPDITNPSVKSLAKILKYNDLMPIHSRDGAFMANYIFKRLMGFSLA